MPPGLAKLIVGMGSEDSSKEEEPSEPGAEAMPEDDRFTDLAGEMMAAFEAKDVASLATLLRAIAGEGSAK